MKTNIISVANLLSLKNRTLSDIDDNEIADLEKKMDDEGISVDKKVFFKALKNYPDSFQFVLKVLFSTYIIIFSLKK